MANNSAHYSLVTGGRERWELRCPGDTAGAIVEYVTHHLLKLLFRFARRSHMIILKFFY